MEDGPQIRLKAGRAAMPDVRRRAEEKVSLRTRGPSRIRLANSHFQSSKLARWRRSRLHAAASIFVFATAVEPIKLGDNLSTEKKDQCRHFQ